MAIIAQPITAGLVVKAMDTGRVLMVQRSITHPHKHAAGRWEWPGGRVEGTEAPLDTAKREWTEETGSDLPDGTVVGSWTSAADKNHVTLVWVIDTESDVTPSGLPTDEVSAAAWWDPNILPGNHATRIELQSSDWTLIGQAGHIDEQRSTGLRLERRKKAKDGTKRQTFGIDIDGTLTAAPEQYTSICSSLRANGHKVIVVTARPNAKEFLAHLGFDAYDDIVTVERSDNVGKDKAKALAKAHADFMFENRLASGPDIAEVCPVTMQFDGHKPLSDKASRTLDLFRAGVGGS